MESGEHMVGQTAGENQDLRVGERHPGGSKRDPKTKPH